MSLMRNILFILLVVKAIASFPQTGIQITTVTSGVTCTPDKGYPSFPGGFDKMVSFIEKNENDSIKKLNITGRIFIEMTVDTIGSIIKIKMAHGINPDFDKEVLRIFSIMPKWIPAEKEGKKIEKAFIFPIRFE